MLSFYRECAIIQVSHRVLYGYPEENGMFRALYTLFVFIGQLIRHIAMGRKLGKLPPQERMDQSLRTIVKVGERTIQATGSRVIYHGVENIPDEPVYIAANHQSVFDVFVLLAEMDRPSAFIAKKSLAKVPLLHKWLELLGCLYLDREDARQAVKVMRQAANQMTEYKMNMIVFPEGTRSRGGELHPFKKGSLKPAFMAKVPVLPAFIDGTAGIFEGNRGLCVKPTEVHVYFGQPIPTKDMDRQAENELAEQIGGIITALREPAGQDDKT